MSQKNLANWLKIMILGVGICTALVYVLVFPNLGKELEPFADSASLRMLWLGLLGLTGVPCYIALFFSWKIMTNIGNDVSFTKENAKLLKYISVLATLDVLFLFTWNMVLFLLGKSHLILLAACLITGFLGIVIAVIFAALSHLVQKAAVLQEQSDFTI